MIASVEASEPYAPPAEAEVGSGALVSAFAAWMFAGATSGTLLGATLAIAGFLPGAAIGGVGGAGAAAVAGLSAIVLDQRLADGRPLSFDARGRATRPIGAWVTALPLAFAGIALLGLVVIGAVAANSLKVGGLFALLALAVPLLLRPVVARHLLMRAVADAEAGRNALARERFLTVARGWWAPRYARSQAWLNVGLLALHDGDLDEAANAYSRPALGRAAGFARSGLALVYALSGRLEEADDELALALSEPGSGALQAETDGVRLLVVWRRDGLDAARALGEQLVDHGSGALFRGILAVLRDRGGDAAGAQALLDPRTRAVLGASGVAARIPELFALLGRS